jgi:hypothetical protein
MHKKIVETYCQIPSCKRVAEILRVNEKTVRKYVELDGASAEAKPTVAATIEGLGKENKFPRIIKMLESGRPMVEVAAELGLEPDEAETYFEHYVRIKKMDFLVLASKKDLDTVVKTVELLQLVEKEGFSPSSCVQEIKVLGSLPAARRELRRLNGEIQEGRAAADRIAQENERAFEELSKTHFVIALNKDSLAEKLARLEKAEKECASVETRCKEANVKLMRLQSSMQTLQSNSEEIMVQARSGAIREARAVLSNDPRLVRSFLGALVICTCKNPSVLLTLWSMIVGRRDLTAIVQYFEPLGQAMLDEIYDEQSREAGDFAACKAWFAHPT